MGNSISYEKINCQVDIPNLNAQVKGLQYDNKSRRFAGIPYAQLPIGDRRWRKPQPLSRFDGFAKFTDKVYDATEFGPVCPQAAYSKAVAEHAGGHVYDEDCLRLNIWTPIPKADEPHPKTPVMIWFHGGWFQIGDASQEEAMDPTELISTGNLNAVFVAVGYRLNVFGFLAGDALQQESGGLEVGNYGLWDQRLAIEWVHQNISAFGGDPNNIILSGRSAGAYAVQAQILYSFQSAPNDASQNYIRGLVMYSNAIPAQPKTVAECQPQFDELCQHFNINPSAPGPVKLEALRAIKTLDLCSAIMKLKYHTFRPVTDDIFIKSNLLQYHTDGSFAQEFRRRDLRLYIGEVLNEETLYAATNGPDPGLSSLEIQLSNYYSPSTTQRLLKHYPPPSNSNPASWKILFGNIVADGQVRAPSRFLVNSLIQHGVPQANVWRYLIAYRMSFITEKIAPKEFGVSHAMDRPIWNYSITHSPTIQERQLLDLWIKDLVAFVNDTPNHSFGTTSRDEYKVMTPQGTIEVQKDEKWDTLLDLAGVFSG